MRRLMYKQLRTIFPVFIFVPAFIAMMNRFGIFLAIAFGIYVAYRLGSMFYHRRRQW